MDLIEMREEVRLRLGVPTSDAFYEDGGIDRFVNNALQYISTCHPWYWQEEIDTITTVAADDTYALPADYIETVGIYDDTGIPLERRSIGELERLTVAENDNQRFYCIYEDQVVVRPVPSAGGFDLTHRYIRQEPDLVNNNDEPLMPSHFHPAIVDYACFLGEARAGNDGKSELWMASYNNWEGKMLKKQDAFSADLGGGRVAPGDA